MARLVLFNFNEDPETRSEVVLTDDLPPSEVRRIARLFCGRGWIMDRRPSLHTFGERIGLEIRLSPSDRDQLRRMKKTAGVET